LRITCDAYAHHPMAVNNNDKKIQDMPMLGARCYVTAAKQILLRFLKNESLPKEYDKQSDFKNDAEPGQSRE
jgi:hypothetical protein